MFLRAAKTDAEAAGESTEGMANSISELREEILALTGGAVDIQIDENTYKSTYQILQELSKVYDKLTDVSQANLLELLGGKRNSNVVAALLENFSVAEESLATSVDSAGSAMAENEKYLDSINGKISIFKASFEELSNNFIDSELVKSIVDIGTGLFEFLNMITKVFNALGGLKTVLIALVPYFTIFKTESLISGFTLMIKPITLLIDKFKALPSMTGIVTNVLYSMTRQMAAGASKTEALSVALKGLNISLTALKATALALFAVVTIAALEEIIETTDEANEALAESKAEYKAVTDEIKSLNDELATINERISELQNKGKLSFTEKEELLLLQRESAELERQIQLLKIKQDTAQKQQYKDFITSGKSFRSSPAHAGIYVDGNGKYQVGLVSDEKHLNQLYSSYNNYLASGDTKQASEYLLKISDIVNKAIDAVSDLEYIDNPLTPQQEEVNRTLDFYNDIIDKYQIISGMQGSKKSSLDRLTTQTFTKDVSGLIADDNVTVEELQVDKYDEFINKCIELGIITDNSTTSLEFLASYFNSTGDAALSSANAITQLSNSARDFKTVAENITSMSSAFEMLDKVYADIINGDEFDFSSVLGNTDFEKTFSGLDEYNDFIKTITSNSDDISACQASFDKLVASYLVSSDAMRNVTVESREMAIAFLEQNGVVNAAAVVDAQLAINQQRLQMANQGVTITNTEEAESYYKKAEAMGIASEALAEMLLQEMRINSVKITTSDDVENILNIARAANIAKKEIAGLTEIMALMSQYEAERDKISDPRGKSAYTAHYIEPLRQKAQSIINEVSYDDYNIKSSYSGGSASDKAREEASKNQKTWFDKQLAEHKHRVAMEQETDAEYFKWLESSYKKAYNEGIIKLEDYYKYEEEVYNGRKELFKNHLSDKEHEISILEDYGNQSEKIIDIYDGLINDVERELADARARGLDGNNDYIQELESQWQKYYDELFDIFKDHLNDVEHEISMRENYDGESARIIKLYEGLKLDVEKEIADLRAQGYTDEDEKIQYLQSQWQNYDKEIRDIRKDAADEAKDVVNDLVEYRVDMLNQEIQDEKDALNEKLDNLKDFYDKQKEMLQDQYDEEKYLEEQAEKRKSVSDIESELAMLEFDDSAWAQKRKLELREELISAQKDLENFEEDHALDLALDAIDDASEAQEKQIEAQMNALDERLNDPQALYNQALIEIASGTHDIYREMQEYNNKHGSGNPDDIDEKYENAYKALQEYESIYGKSYKGIELNNSTNYSPDKGSWDSEAISGTNPVNKTPISSPALPPSSSSSSSSPSSSSSNSSSAITKGSTVTVKTSATHFSSKSGGIKMASHVPGGTYTVMDISGDQVLIGKNGTATGWVNKSDLNIKGSTAQTSSSSTQAPSLSKGSTVTIKTSATHFGSKSKGVRMASYVPGGTYTVMNVSGDQILIGRNGAATGWVNKSDIVGYAKGTAYARSGIARIFEEGYEQIFTSVDGSKYKLFNNGDKVLNAKATEFLYDFAESGGAILKTILSHALYGKLPNLNDKIIPTDIHMGDIIIYGNADNSTVSEIRRAQRENIDYILSKFSKLNK